MPYVLEVEKFVSKSLIPAYRKHVGYVDKIFSTKKEAAEYYDSFHPHMRSLNANKTWRSDYDPETRFMYIVRMLQKRYYF